MQQYSSVPEKQSQLEDESRLAIKFCQLQAQLWLERSLNQLQTRFNDSISTTSQPMGEAEILQIFVDELNQALPTSWFAIAQSTGSVLNNQSGAYQSDTIQTSLDSDTYHISVVSHHPLHRDPIPELTMKTTGKKLRLRARAIIDINDLLDLQTRQPVRALPIPLPMQENHAWLLMVSQFNNGDIDDEDISHGEVINSENIHLESINCDINHNEIHNSESEALAIAQNELAGQLMARAIQQCVTVMSQLQKLRSLEQCCLNLEKFNQDLERTNQLKNQFLANTSHEIRTPLSSILGFTHLLIAQGFDPEREKHQEYLNIIQSSGKHLLALINDILDLSKIEANQMEVQWERVELQQLCRNVFALIKEKAANKGLKLSLAIAPEVTTIIADSLRLKQMLLNLLFNALKFTTTGTVGLEINRHDSCIHFVVWDTGTGIPKEHLAELFQPYSQIANPVVSREEGTGLGLALTRKLAELQQGTIQVESEINHGSRFTIILPCQPVGVILADQILEDCEEIITHTPLQDYPLAIPEPPNPSRLRQLPRVGFILLIEDDADNAQLIKIFLEKQGYQVKWVRTASHMWEVLAQTTPELILMDIYLPDVDGLKLISQIRDRELFRYTPIIAQTAMAMKSDRDVCLGAGFDEYISKPLDLTLLADLVAKYSEPAVEGSLE